MKPRWWRRLLALAGFGCLWIDLCDDPPLVTGGCVQDVAPDAATLACVTATDAEASLIVRGPDGAVVHSSGDGPVRRHTFRVTGLQPGIRYGWELAVEGVGVDQGTFRTARLDDGAPVRFAFLGDSGRVPWWVWLQRTPILHWPARWQWLPTSDAVTRVGAAVAAFEPEFVLHLGDIVYPRGLHAHYAAAFFRPFAPALRHAPIYAVLGNHDAMDADGLQALANLGMPANWLTGDGRCMSFVRGPVRILGLDCNTDRTGDRFGPEHPAMAFLRRELGEATEPWIVVATHFPMRSASRQADRAELLLGLLPTLREFGVDLYLSGHDHCYQRFDGGEEGPAIVVSGGGGKDLYEVRPQPQATLLRALSLASAHHWCAAEVVGSELRVRAVGLGGQDLDQFRLPLAEGARLERLRRVCPARAGRIEALGKR